MYILDTIYSAGNSVENVGLMGFLTIIQNFVLPYDLISGIFHVFLLPFHPLDCGLNQDIPTILESNLTKVSMGQFFSI